jgi:hypothetical protein
MDFLQSPLHTYISSTVLKTEPNDGKKCAKRLPPSRLLFWSPLGIPAGLIPNREY